MEIAEYQKGCAETAIYRDGVEKAITENIPYLEYWLRVDYCAAKMTSEAGEASQEVSKALRDDAGMISAERKERIFKELGDVSWYLAMMCNELGFQLEDVMDYNLTKLRDRQNRGALPGSGSDR